MRTAVILLFWFICSATNMVHAQSNSQNLIDSLVVKLKNSKDDVHTIDFHNQLFVAYRNQANLNLAGEHARKALALAEKIQFKEGIATSQNNLAVTYAVRGDFNQAVFYFEKALALRMEMGQEIQAASLAVNIGITHARRGNYPEGLEKFFFALPIFEKLNNPNLVANANLNIGNIYYFTRQYENAEKYLLRAIEGLIKTGDKRNLAGAYTNLAPVYGDSGDDKKALEYYKKAYHLADSLEHISLKALILDNMGLIYEYSGDYEQSLLYYQGALEIAEATQDTLRIGLNHFKMGKLLNKQKKPAEALNYLQSSLKIAEKIGDLKNLHENYESIAVSHVLLGDTDAALQSFRQYSLFKDSVFNNENTREIARIEVRYEAEEKQDSLRYASQQKELMMEKEMFLAAQMFEFEKQEVQAKQKEEKRILQIEEEAKRKIMEGQFLIALAESQLKMTQDRNVRNGLWVVLACVLLIGGLLFNQSLTWKKNNRLLSQMNKDLEEANSVKLQFFHIINHDFRRPVANLIHFLQIKKQTPELLEEMGEESYENKILHNAENLLDNMEDLLLWSKGQMDHFKPHFEEVSLHELFMELKNHFNNETISVNFVFDDTDHKLKSDVNLLKSILRNIVGNALNAFEGQKNPIIQFKVSKDDGSTRLMVIDNGSGADPSSFSPLFDRNSWVGGQKSGLGLHLIRDLAKALQCVIEVDSQKGKGTRFTLHFPLL